MENASKALTMAGGVLISLLVIGLLVFFYNNIQGWQQIGQETDEIAQATEFNKQYDVYDREVYGSELLSLANKINDYNERESKSKGYQKIELQVIMKKPIGGNTTKYFKDDDYSAEKLESEKNELEKARDDVKEKKVKGIRIDKLSTMRREEIEDLKLTDKEYQDYLKYTNEYNTLKNLLITVKSTVFGNIEFKYDEHTGRIIKMTYRH